jgi:hypothetical protein
MTCVGMTIECGRIHARTAHELTLHIRPGQADITQHVVVQSHNATTGGASSIDQTQNVSLR